MKKLKVKRYAIVIGIIAVLFLLLSIVLGVIYYKSPVYENNIFKIYKTDKFIFSDMAGSIEGEGQTRTKFSNDERKIIYDFLKQLKVKELYQEAQQDVGLPPELTIHSRYYEAYFKIWSSHAVYCVITYKDKDLDKKSSHYYLFTASEETFKQINNLLDSH